MRNLIYIALLFIPSLLFAQKSDEEEKNFIIEQIIEQIAENLDDESIDYTTLFDQLSYFFDHPINLNHCTPDELRQLPLLNEFQIQNLFKHIEDNGKLLTIYELQTIPGMDVDLIRNLMPFVVVTANFDSPNLSFKEMIVQGKQSIYLRYFRVLEDQKGYQHCGEFNAPANCNEDSVLALSPNKKYVGSPDHLYFRYRYKYGQNISIGLTAEKDAGEDFFTGTQKNGFDYYSAHFFLKNIGIVKQLAVGDYHVQFGQGLTLWSGLAFGKSSMIMNNKRNALGLRPYTSVDENLFMRGLASTIAVGKVEFTGFYSKKRIDANLNATDTLNNNDIPTITSFQNTGLHSTAGELTDKHAIGEVHYGGHIAIVDPKFNIGFTAFKSQYDANVSRSLQTYNQFEFDSNENVVAGMDYNYLLNNFNFYGEISRSQNGAVAYQNGMLISLDKRLSLSLVQRHYPANYQNLISNAFADGSKNTNEDGMFVGMQFKPKEHWELNAYMDYFKSRWLRFGVDEPNNHGIDWFVRFAWKPSKKTEIYGQIRNRDKPKNTADNVLMDYVTDYQQTNYRVNLTYKISDSWTLRNRVEIVKWNFENTHETGFLAYQDVMFKPLSSSFSFTFRYAFFDTDSYNSRIYAYENDVLYYFSIPSYYSRGTRTYITVQYKAGRHIDMWLRLSQWYYNDRTTILSGLNEIQGNTKTEIRAQIRYKF